MYCLDMTGYYKTHIQGQTTPPEEQEPEKESSESSSSDFVADERADEDSSDMNEPALLK